MHSAKCLQWPGAAWMTFRPAMVRDPGFLGLPATNCGHLGVAGFVSLKPSNGCEVLGRPWSITSTPPRMDLRYDKRWTLFPMPTEKCCD